MEVVFIYLVEVVMYLVVLTMIAMVTAAATKPGVFVGVGLGCLVAGILAFLVAPEFAQNPNEPVYEPGNGGMGVALSIGFVLVVLGVVALFGALLGSLIKRIRRRNDPPRPSSAPSTHRRERSAHRPTTHRREGRGGPGSLAGGASP